MDRDDHLINEALGDVFKQLNKDQHRAPFAEPGEKQGDCEEGYVLNKKGDCVKKTEVVEDDRIPHPHSTSSGPLNKERGGVKAYGERNVSGPSSTNLAVHGSGSTPSTGPKAPWGTGQGFPGQTTSGANKFNLLNAQDGDSPSIDSYNPHPIKDAIYINKEDDRYVFTRNGKTLIATRSDRQLKEWATHYAAKGRGRFSAGKKIYPGEGVNIDL